MNKAQLQALLLSVHVPQEGRSQEEREEALQRMQQVIEGQGNTVAVVAGIDSNSRPPGCLLSILESQGTWLLALGLEVCRIPSML